MRLLLSDDSANSCDNSLLHFLFPVFMRVCLFVFLSLCLLEFDLSCSDVADCAPVDLKLIEFHCCSLLPTDIYCLKGRESTFGCSFAAFSRQVSVGFLFLNPSLSFFSFISS